MIVVFGATGRTGGEAARALSERGTKVRWVVRSAARLSALGDEAVDGFVADLEDAGAVERALTGAESAYLLIPPNFGVDDFRGYQRRCVTSLSEGLRRSGVEYVVLLSSLGADHPAGTGPIVGLHELEQELRGIAGLNVLSVRAGYFMENFLMNVGMVRSMGILGTPAPADAPMALIAAADIGRYAAERLAARDFSGFEVVNLIGPELVTLADVTRVVGAAIGEPDLPYVQFSYEDAEKGMVQAGLKPQLAALYTELYRGAAAGLLKPEPGTVVVATTTPFEDFAKVFAAAYRQAARAESPRTQQHSGGPAT
jgi:uncharacterized protein YbjT (DUF2867 family)